MLAPPGLCDGTASPNRTGDLQSHNLAKSHISQRLAGAGAANSNTTHAILHHAPSVLRGL